ncbi:MAG: arylsulfatase A-like enzyme [Mariniblastus sp.]
MEKLIHRLLIMTFVLATWQASVAFASGCEIPREDPTVKQPPNILMIFLDDFGWKDTSFMGSDFYETPNLDRLAKGGMVFNNAYSCAANCAPARACLLSGQYTPRHEIYNVGTKPRGKTEHRRLAHIPGVETLDPNIKTWAHQLQAAGYKTASIGKWHLSDDPLPYGFDVNVGGTRSGSPPRGYYPPHNNIPSLAGAQPDEYLTDRLSDEACQFIADNKDHPWMLYLTHFAVHTPIQPKKELVKKYEVKSPGELHDNVKMATMIQAVDDGVEKLMATLEEYDLRDNTVIIFFSDNGGYGPATDMDPLKGYKGTYYEGGIRVPFFVNWPGQVSPNSTCGEPIIGVDLYPTLCEITGAKLPAGQAGDGVSLVPLFQGKVANLNVEEEPRSLYWHFPAYLDAYAVWDEQQDPLFRSRPCSVVRQGKWKLIHWFETGENELYDLEADISETTNAALANQAVVNSLSGNLKNWQTQTKAAIPSQPNPGFDEQAEQRAIAAKRAGGGKIRGKNGGKKNAQKKNN